MDELVTLVASKAGISEEQARQAIAAVLEFVKTHFPQGLAMQVEAALGSDVSMREMEQHIDSAADSLGGFLSKVEKNKR